MLFHRSRATKYIFAAFVLVVLMYAFFEARNVLYGPQILLGTTGAITVTDALVEISGTVKNVTSFTLDGRSVFISDSGVFLEKVLLAEGLNEFVFEASDKFDNQTREVLKVVYLPKKGERPNLNADSITNTEEPLPDN